MAKLIGLDVIAVTDHNAIAQLEATAEVAKKEGLSFIYGIEVQTIEEVHVLCYFKTYSEIELFYQRIRPKLIYVPNDLQFFGEQIIYNSKDEIVAHEDALLLSSIDLSIDEIEMLCHQCGGCFILAHAIDKINSITTQLGFIPPNLKFDGIEIRKLEDKERILKMNPWIEDTIWLINSDAHQLVDIQEAIYQLETIEVLWRR